MEGCTMTDIKQIIARIDELMEAANPPDGSAPLGPIVQIGNLINDKWPTIRKALQKAEDAGQ
jgi:hypothetical protein